MKNNCKAEIRKRILESMSLIRGSEREKRNEDFLVRLKNDQDVQNAQNIFCFVSFRDEIDTREFIKYLLKNKKRVFVPLIRDGKMLISEIRSFDELKEGFYGIPEPAYDSERIREADALDLVISPGVAFDREGYRIGYGGGYYDRLFADEKLSAEKIGVLFREQLIESVPKNEHDLPVDRIITV